MTIPEWIGGLAKAVGEVAKIQSGEAPTDYERGVRDGLLRAADLVESQCTCMAFWADYGRRDPSCRVHDAAEALRAEAARVEVAGG